MRVIPATNVPGSYRSQVEGIDTFIVLRSAGMTRVRNFKHSKLSQKFPVQCGCLRDLHELSVYPFPSCEQLL